MPVGGVSELGAGDAEGGVRAGVAEVPGKLHGGDFYLEGGGVCAGVAGGGPEALSADGKEGEEEGKGEERVELDAAQAAGLVAMAEGKTGEQEKVDEDEQGEGDPEIEEEVLVEGDSMGGGVAGQPPSGRG